MGERTGHARVLVVADRDEIRTPISRALSAGGYQVDAVSSLTTTKPMDPAGYDVVLVEAKLGSPAASPIPLQAPRRTPGPQRYGSCSRSCGSSACGSTAP